MIDYRKYLTKCRICPRNCGVNRFLTSGFCRSKEKIKINIWQKHFGEEPVFSGTRGSGTIFFSNCNLRCVYCQNFKISEYGNGREITDTQLAEIMIKLQNENVHNINLVTPTHFTLNIINSIEIARSQGLEIPIIWNTSGYEKVETIRKLSGLVDIFLTDLRYFHPANSAKYSLADDYFSYASNAIKAMKSQVGDLITDADGIAKRGILIRLLVLPNHRNDLKSILNWIKENLGTETNLSLMSQYYPTHKAAEFPEINRGLTKEEYAEAEKLLVMYGFENGFRQELEITPDWTPDFNDEVNS